MSGGSGKGIELDALVESEVVKPIKQYASRHSTVTVCERIMGNLDLSKPVRKGYTARECLTSIIQADKVFSMQFMTKLKAVGLPHRRDFLKCDKKRKHIECYPVDNGGLPSGKLASNYTDVLASDKEKVKEIFNEKVYELFLN